jgi:glutamate/tyrosine decarboxylase-like PLP-dependent enzyme
MFQLKEKEHAYLRILSEEWNKRDEEREKQLIEKTRILDEQNKKMTQEIRRIELREEELRRLQNEVCSLLRCAEGKYVVKQNIHNQNQIKIKTI